MLLCSLNSPRTDASLPGVFTSADAEGGHRAVNTPCAYQEEKSQKVRRLGTPRAVCVPVKSNSGDPVSDTEGSLALVFLDSSCRHLIRSSKKKKCFLEAVSPSLGRLERNAFRFWRQTKGKGEKRKRTRMVLLLQWQVDVGSSAARLAHGESV